MVDFWRNGYYSGGLVDAVETVGCGLDVMLWATFQV